MDPILIWARIVTSRTETLNWDISSFKNDTEMVDQSMKALVNFKALLMVMATTKKMLSFLGSSFKFANNL